MPDLKATPGKEPKILFENGKARVVSHDGSEEIISSLVFNQRLSQQLIRHYCGALLHQRFIDKPLPEHEMADVIDRAVIPLGVVPNRPIIKMMKPEHAELLTKHGIVRLGSIEYYRRHENPEVQDEAEGYCVLAGFDGEQTHIREVRGGLNDRILCCYAGPPDWEIVQRFGYDAAVEIINVEAFSLAIGQMIKAKQSIFSSCIYVRDRAIWGEGLRKVDPQEMMDGQFSEMLGDARAFLKNNRYQHQSEFRFVWRGDGHSEVPSQRHCSAILAKAHVVFLPVCNTRQ